MFGLLKNKKIDLKKEKIRLIERIESAEEVMKNNGLYSVNIQLDKIINRLDNEYLELNKEQISTLDQCISTFESHANKMFEGLLINKCNHINACISSKDAAADIKNATIKNEDKLFEMLGQLSIIDTKIKELDKKMNEALGKDKVLWQMLNSQKTNLKNQALVITKTYNTLLTVQNNAALAKYVKDAKEASEDIADQNSYIDIQDFTSNSDFISSVQNEVNETSNMMNETLANNFQLEDSDYSYEKALEEKCLASNNNENPTNFEENDKL